MCNNFQSSNSAYKYRQELKIKRFIQSSFTRAHLPEQNSTVRNLSQAPMQELHKTDG